MYAYECYIIVQLNSHTADRHIRGSEDRLWIEVSLSTSLINAIVYVVLRDS
jgi:hypothetical protein